MTSTLRDQALIVEALECYKKIQEFNRDAIHSTDYERERATDRVTRINQLLEG